MAKQLIQKAGSAAVESLLEQFLSRVMMRLDSIESGISDLRKNSLELRKEMNERFERTQALINNELGIRINTVDTRLDTFIDFVRRDSIKMDAWLERLVRVEETQKMRSRKAG
jgi:hypothetical protein